MTVENADLGGVAPGTQENENHVVAPTTTDEISSLRGILGMEEEEKINSEETPNPETPPTDPNEPIKPAASGKVELSPEVQAILDRRIGKEIAKRKDLESAIKSAKARIEALETESPHCRESLAGILNKDLTIVDEAELTQYEDDIRSLRRWARKHQATGYEDEKSGVSFSAQDITDRLDAIEDVLESKIPRARAIGSQRQAADEKARKRFPALFDEDSSDAREAEAFIKLVPEIRRVPEYRLLVGAMIAGLKVSAKPSATPPPPTIPRPANRPSTLPGGKTIAPKPGQDVEAFISKGGTTDALTELMASGRY